MFALYKFVIISWDHICNHVCTVYSALQRGTGHIWCLFRHYLVALLVSFPELPHACLSLPKACFWDCCRGTFYRSDTWQALTAAKHGQKTVANVESEICRHLRYKLAAVDSAMYDL